MKTRKLLLIVTIISIFFCLSGCAGDPVESTPVENDGVTDTIPENLHDELIHRIEVAYKEEQELPDNQTTIGMIELSAKYQTEWKKVADQYYNLIMEYEYPSEILPHEMEYYSTDNLRAAVSGMKTNWEKYYNTESDNYRTTLICTYGPGTIVGPIFADYQYQMQKEWALKLVDIYEQLV